MTTIHYPFTLLATNFTSGGAAPAARAWPGGDGYLIVQGTIGSATMQLKFAGPADVIADNDIDNTDEITPTVLVGSSVAAVGMTTFSAPAGMLQAVMGGTGGSGLYVAVYRKPMEVA